MNNQTKFMCRCAFSSNCQTHQGKSLLVTGFFNMHYTTQRTYSKRMKQQWLSILLKDTSVTTETWTHTLLTRHTRASVQCTRPLCHDKLPTHTKQIPIVYLGATTNTSGTSSGRRIRFLLLLLILLQSKKTHYHWGKEKPCKIPINFKTWG